MSEERAPDVPGWRIVATCVEYGADGFVGEVSHLLVRRIPPERVRRARVARARPDDDAVPRHFLPERRGRLDAERLNCPQRLRLDDQRFALATLREVLRAVVHLVGGHEAHLLRELVQQVGWGGVYVREA